MTQRASSYAPTPHLLQIDLIKAAAIVAVIVMHAMTTTALEQP
jgi:surface polysaccharide O-acyltransferase-like enzyme